jgi:hypothetical protein
MVDAKKIKIFFIIIILATAITLIALNHTHDIFLSDNTSSIKPSSTIPPPTLPPSLITTKSITPPPFINPIKNFVLKNSSKELIEYLDFIKKNIESNENKILDEFNILDELKIFDENYILDENKKLLEETILNSNMIWDGDINKIITPNETDIHRLAAQFRYFAEFWLNLLNINSGFTDVLDLNGIIGKYEFSRNKNVYTGKFNNYEWSWNINKNYCFNTVNSKRKNNCMGGWTYVNGKCFSKATDSSTCYDYDWKKVADYPYKNEFDSWMNNCNITNSSDCINP